MLPLNLWDGITLGAYLALTLVIGAWFSKRASSGGEEGFFLAGRQLPWWILGTSMVATTFALDTPLLIAQTLVTHGLFGNWIWLSLAVSHLFVTFFLAGRWRRAEVVTDAELCEVRYGGRGAAWLRGVKGLFFALVLNGLTLGGVFFAVKQICYAFGVDAPPAPGEAEALLSHANVALFVCLGLSFIYAAAAGFWGVVATDLVQFVLAMAGAVLVAGFALADPRVGGLSGLVEKAQAASAQALRLAPEGLARAPFEGAHALPFGVFASDAGIELLVFLGVMWWAWKYADGGGILIQRMSAAKDERQATLGTLWFCLAHYVLRWWPWAVAGLAALVILDISSVADPALRTQLANQSYPRLVTEVVPIGLRGFVLAYFAAAFMSTVDTHLNLGSAYLVHDVYRRFLAPEASDRHYVRIARVVAIVILALGMVASRYATSFRGLLGLILNLVAGAGSVFLLRWFWWRVSAWSELAALTASLAIGGGLSLWNASVAAADRIPYWQVTLWNVGGSGVLWLLVTAVAPPAPMERLVDFYRRTRPLGLWGPVRERAGLAREPFPGVALACWLASIAACFGSLYGIRELLLGHALVGGACLAGCAVAGVLVVRAVLRS